MIRVASLYDLAHLGTCNCRSTDTLLDDEALVSYKVVVWGWGWGMGNRAHLVAERTRLSRTIRFAGVYWQEINPTSDTLCTFEAPRVHPFTA